MATPKTLGDVNKILFAKLEAPATTAEEACMLANTIRSVSTGNKTESLWNEEETT